jgi:hypothetical protein
VEYNFTGDGTKKLRWSGDLLLYLTQHAEAYAQHGLKFSELRVVDPRNHEGESLFLQSHMGDLDELIKDHAPNTDTIVVSESTGTLDEMGDWLARALTARGDEMQMLTYADDVVRHGHSPVPRMIRVQAWEAYVYTVDRPEQITQYSLMRRERNAKHSLIRSSEIHNDLCIAWINRWYRFEQVKQIR